MKHFLKIMMSNPIGKKEKPCHITPLSTLAGHHLYIYSFAFFCLLRVNSQSDQLPDGLIAQSGRALHRYRRGHRFEYRSGLNLFFSGFNFTTA